MRKVALRFIGFVLLCATIVLIGFLQTRLAHVAC